MAITVGDVLDNIDLFWGILEVRMINDKRDNYSIVPAQGHLDVEVRSIRTYEGSEPKTVVTIFEKDCINENEENLARVWKNYIEKNCSNDEGNDPLEQVRRELEINKTWDEHYKEKNNDKTLSIFDINFNNYDIDFLKSLISGSTGMIGENKLYVNFIDFMVQKTNIDADSIEKTNWGLVYEKQREVFLILEEKIIIDFEQMAKTNIISSPIKISQKEYIKLAKEYLINKLGKDLNELFEEPNNLYKVELRLKSSYKKIKQTN